MAVQSALSSHISLVSPLSLADALNSISSVQPFTFIRLVKEACVVRKANFLIIYEVLYGIYCKGCTEWVIFIAYKLR